MSQMDCPVCKVEMSLTVYPSPMEGWFISEGGLEWLERLVKNGRSITQGVDELVNKTGYAGVLKALRCPNGHIWEDR